MEGAVAGLVLVGVLVIFAAIVVAKSVALIPQAEAAVIERLGRYSKTVSGQLTLLLPFIDRIRARVDLRERVVSFPPQPVITEDNLTVNIDTVVYFQVTNPQAAVYQISNYIVGVEQLTTTTLRNVVGGMTLEQTLTSRDQINAQLRGAVLPGPGPGQGDREDVRRHQGRQADTGDAGLPVLADAAPDGQGRGQQGLAGA